MDHRKAVELASAFSHAPCAMAIVNLGKSQHGHLVEVNDALCGLVGRDRNDLVGMQLDDLLQYPRNAGDPLDNAVTRDGQQCSTAVTCCLPGGGRTSAELRISVLPTTRGAPIHAVAALQESCGCGIGARDLDNRERYLAQIVENAASLIYITDPDGNIVYINKHYADTFNVELDAVRGKSGRFLFAAEVADEFAKNDRMVLSSGVAHELEEPAPGAHGTYRTVKFPVYNELGSVYGVAGISTDITDIKTAEAATREAREKAERADRTKSEFLSRVSHELRTPLNSILGFGQLLLLEELNDNAADSVASIVLAGKSLLSLINELLDLSQIESGGDPVSLTAVHACDPFNEALRLVRPLAQERNIDLICDFHGGLWKFVLADYRRLEQVMLNLLTNAVKYNETGGRVQISFEAHEDGVLRYLISDTGPGVDDEDLERMFLPFERLAANGTPTEGAGLGLSVSKALVEAMGGKIGALSDEASYGATFYVDLKQTPPPRDAHRAVFGSANDQPSAESLGDATIVCIEDDPVSAELVRKTFARFDDVIVVWAADGESGLSTVRGSMPDLVLLDLHLPDNSGEEIVRRIKEIADNRTIPVVVLSADATPTKIDKVKDCGADDYITKPFEVSQLVRTVAELLRPDCNSGWGERADARIR